MNTLSVGNRVISLGLMWGAAILYLALVRFLPANGNQISFGLPLASFVVGIVLYAKNKYATSASILKTLMSTIFLGGGILLLTLVASTMVAFSAV